MSYFTDFNPVDPMNALIEDDRIIDIRDKKWGHPLLMEGYLGWDQSANAASNVLFDRDFPLEQKRQMVDGIIGSISESLFGENAPEHTCDITEHEAPGCPEEPDTPAKVVIYRPKTLTGNRARCIFYCIGGAIVMVEPNMFPLEELACRYNCVIVAVKYRRSFEAQYPAQVNDLHAGFQWMLDNAKELGINPKKVVVTGQSSGAQFALALPFRLKRYGITPRGVVAVVPQTDDRERGTKADYLYGGSWGGARQRACLYQYLGPDNFASSRVGGEALANHATVEDCIGLPPTIIHTAELDPDRDNNREFYGKLLEAQVYAEYHCWAGAHHSASLWCGATVGGEPNPYSERVKAVIDGNINDLFDFDLSRPWTVK